MAQDKYSQNRQLAYDLLKQEGYTDIGDSAEELFKNKANSELAYQLLSQAGYTDIGKDYNEFANMLYGPQQSSRPTTETEQVEQVEQPAKPARQIDQAAAAEGRQAFQNAIASRREVSTKEDIPQATQKYMAENPVEGGKRDFQRTQLVDQLNEAKKINEPIIAEYEKRLQEYNDSEKELTGEDNVGPWLQSTAERKAWLDEHQQEYNDAKESIQMAEARLNYYDKPRVVEEIDAQIAKNQKHVAPKAISTTGTGYFPTQGAGYNMEESHNYEAANEILGMAKQTYQQGSKADPGYEGNGLEQVWTAARQFVEGGINNVDMGSLTYGLSEGSALIQARRAGDKYNKAIEKAGISEDDDMETAYQKAEKAYDSLTDGEKALLEALVEYSDAQIARQNDVSVASAAGAGAEQSAEFMLDFILTGGLEAVGKKAVGKLLRRQLGKKVKFGEQVLSDVATSALRTAVMLPRNLAAYGENLTQIDWEAVEKGTNEGKIPFARSHMNAALNTALTQYIEYWSEGFGEYFAAGEKKLFQAVTKKAPKTAIGKTLTQYRGSIGQFLDHGKFNGQFNEMLEEVVGSLFNSTAGWLSGDRVGDSDAIKEFWSGENLATLFFSFLPMTAISTRTNIKAYNTMKEHYDNGVKVLSPFIENGAISQEDLNGLVSDIENKTPEEIVSKIEDITDKARKANGGFLPQNFAQALMGYCEGTFAMGMRNDVWEDSAEKMGVVNAYSQFYANPDERAAYDLSQAEQQAHDAAIQQGYTEEQLDNDAYILAQQALANEDPVLQQYAETKAAMSGLRDGFQKETEAQIAERENSYFNNVAVEKGGKYIMTRAYLNTPDALVGVFVVSPDITVNADGTISTPTGADGLVQYRKAPGYPVETAKASEFSDASTEDFNDWADRDAEWFSSARNESFEQALNTISPLAKAEALYQMQGQNVIIEGNGAYEPVRVERLTHGGENVVISGDRDVLQGVAMAAGINSPGGTRLEIPVENLWDMLAKENDGSLSTEAPQGQPQQSSTSAAPQSDAARPVSGGATLDGRPIGDIRIDEGNNEATFTYQDDPDRILQTMDLGEFSQKTGLAQAPAAPEAPATPAAEVPKTSTEVPEGGTQQPKIPVDKDGNKIYDAPGVEPIDAYEDMYSTEGLSEADVDEWVISQSDEAEKNRNPKIKKGQSLQEWGKEKAEANRKADFWKELRDVAEEHVREREEAAKREADLQAQIEKYGVDTRGFDLTPQTTEEAVAEYLGNSEKLIDLEDAKKETLGKSKSGRIPVELFRHLGNGGILTSKGGRTIQDVANDIVGEYESTLSIAQDEVRDIIIDYLTRYTKSEMREMIFDNRLQAALAELEQQNGTSAEVEEDLPAAEEETIPAEEAVEEAPEGTEVPEEAPVAEPEPAEPETATEEEEDMPPAETETVGQSGAETAPESEGVTSETPENSVPSQEEGAKESGAKEDTSYGSNNKVVSKDRYEELKKKMLAKIKGQANSGFDPEIFAMGVEMAAYHIEAGARKFVDFAKRMINDLTDAIRPYLKGIYNGARDLPGMEDYRDEMDSADYVSGIDINQDFNSISNEQGDSESGVPESAGQGEESDGTDDSSSDGQPVVEGGRGGEVPGDSTGDGRGMAGTGEGGTTTGGRTSEGEGSSVSGDDENAGSGRSGGAASGRGRGRRGTSGRRPKGDGEKSRGRSGEPGGSVDIDRGDEGRSVLTQENYDEERGKSYQESKKELANEGDVASLKELAAKLESEISELDDLTAEKAIKEGQLSAVYDRLREIFAEKNKQTINLDEEKIAYVPVCDPEGKYAIGSVVPAGSAESIYNALRNVEQEEGKSLAEFVKDELGYKSLEEMFSGIDDNGNPTDGLASEQVDGVALAIHNIKKGGQCIIGDMTGVGKGRQGAALVRWALRHNKKCLYVTKNASLFSDAYRDLADIGSGEIRPMAIGDAKEGVIIDADGRKVITNPSSAALKKLYESGNTNLEVSVNGRKVPEKYDYVLTNYDQLNAYVSESSRKSVKDKMQWFKDYAKDAIVILDESHLASGDSNRGRAIQDIVRNSAGVTFMSATFAKTPGNMVLYALKSSLGKSNIPVGQVISDIYEYGTPMQEMLAEGFFSSGEMIRRERDFTGVVNNWPTAEEVYTPEEIRRDRDTYDSVMELMDDIIFFQNKYIAPIIREEEKPYKDRNKVVMDSGEGTKVTFYNTPASGQISNITSLLLLDFRSKKASEMAIASIKNGEKPVVVVDNTNESYIDEVEDGSQTANFASIIRRRFQSIFRYSRIEQDYKNGREIPKQEGGRRTTTYDATESLSADALAQVRIIEEKLSKLENDDRINELPLSPIDDITSKIKSDGYKVGEITGRKSYLENEDGEWKKKSRNVDGKAEARLFNGGSAKSPLSKDSVYDALILNRAGATGISLQSSVKFGDQKQRHELLAQTALDVNEVVQVKGRTDRTGQVHRSIYTYIPSPIPVEQRFLASLKRKLASLDANTSATQNVSSNKVEAVDMENKYGDEVARDYLLANPQINNMLPPGKRLDESDLSSEPTDLMHNLLIGLQRLPCATQESILADLTENYQIKIDYLNQNGTNDLESTVKDLNATTIDKAVFVKGVDESSPSVFLNDANIERVEVDILKEPVRSSAIWQTAKREGAFLSEEKREEKGYSDDILTDLDYSGNILKKAAEMVDKMVEERSEKNKKRVEDFIARLRETIPMLPEQSQEEYDAMILRWPSLQELKTNLEIDLNAYKKELAAQLRYLKAATGDYLDGTTGLVVGKPYLVPVTDYAGDNAPMGYGRFMGFKVGNGKPNSIMAVFAVRDSRAKVEIPVVKERGTINKIKSDSSTDDILLYMGAYESKYRVDKDDMRKWDEWWDGQIPKNSTRQLRYMLTGNITLGAGKVGKYKGGIILFTRKDAKTGEVTNDRGMLLAEDFDPENFPIKEKLTKEELWNSDKTFSDKDISIDVRRSGDQAVVIVNEMHYTDKKGVYHTVKVSTRKKEFDKDETWQRLAGNDPYITRTQVYYYIDDKNVEEFLDHLYYKYGFAKTRMFIMPDSSERVDRIVYTDRPYEDVIDEFGKKYSASSEWSTSSQIRKALEQYKRNINDDALKEKIRELVQLRQAYIRKSIANEESWRLAWAVIENMELEAGSEDKNRREMYGNRKAALLEELAARGVKGRTMHLEQGEISVDRIKELFDKLNKDKFNAEIGKRVFAKVKKSNPDTLLDDKKPSGLGGQARGNLLYYNWKYMNSDWITDQMKANTLLHEAAHNITNYVEYCVDNGYEHLLTQDLVDAKNELDNIFSVIKSDDAFKHDTYDDYGVTDWDELIAEAVSNPDFRADLDKVKLAVRMRSGFLTFSKATGNEPEGTKTISALDAVMERVNTLIDNFNENWHKEAFRGKYGARGSEDYYYRFVEEGMWGPNAENYVEKSEDADDRIARRIEGAELESTNTTLDRMSEELGIKVNKVGRSDMPKGHETDKGFYDTKTGEMTICMDNVTDERDAIATVLHETVGHHGLRQLFGDRFNDAMVRIYAALDANGKRWVNSYIARHPNADNIRAVEEYLSHLAESGNFKNTVWNKIKEIFGKIVDALFGTDGFLLTDNELNYILRASYEHLKNPDWLNTVQGKAFDTLLKRRLGINETDPNKPTDPQGPDAGRLYRDGDTGVANDDYNTLVDSWENKMLTENQDADRPVRIGMDKVMKEKGIKSISEDEDYVQRHNLASSRAESQAHEFELFKFSPLMDQVRAIQSRILAGTKATKATRQAAYERILDYMYAVSGLERNNYKNAEIEADKQNALAGVTDAAERAKIEKEYEAKKRDWSGITSLMGTSPANWKAAEAQARAMIANFEKAVGSKGMLDELWNRVRACTDYSLEHAYKYGLLTREEFERLHGTASQPRMWNYYLPLRGFSEMTAEEQFSYANFTNPSRNSAVVKKMNGRWTQADNPLANILNIAETEIVQGNDNWAKQALYRFTLNAGDNTLLSASEPWYVKDDDGNWSLAFPEPKFDVNGKQVGTETLEHFEERMRKKREKGEAKKGRQGLKLDNIMVNKAHRNEHAIHLKVGGIDKMIWVNGDPALARAVSGIGRAQNLQWLRRAGRVLSNLFTTYSLDFTAKNLIRDTTYSFIALHIKEDKAYRHQYYKNWIKNFGYGAFAFPMISLAAQWENGKLVQKEQNGTLTPRERDFLNFMRDGGQTGYTIINSVSQIKKDLEKQMRSAGGKPGTIPVLGHYAKAVKTLNEAFELLTRFTAYQTSRDMGRSGQRAASDAKEISVNFNRRGAQSGNGIWGNIAAYLGATHYFYNAGVQGFDNFLGLFKKKPGKMSAITAGFVMMGILTPLINSMLAGLAGGGDGDDDWYWNLPEWVRRNNLIIGTGKWYFAFPLPVEFRAPYGIGDIAGSAFCYEKYPNRHFGNVAGDILSTAAGILPVNPVEGYTGNGNLGDAALRAVAPDAGMFFVDWATNRDYTGRPLWKENPFSDTVPKSQGAYASTPKGIVAACQKLAEVSNGEIDIAPGLVRDFMQNYGGGFFRAAEDVSKLLFTDVERPRRWDNVPFFSGFTGHIDEDRSNSFATNALYDYKKLSEDNVKSVNAILNTDDVSASILYDNPETLYERDGVTIVQMAKIKRMLDSKEYKIGKEYREGMNNKYKMKQHLTGAKAGQWYKSREIERKGVETLRKEWKEARDRWASLPDKTEEQKRIKADAYKDVTNAWHLYYDAQGDLAVKLMNIEYNKEQ